MILIIKSSVNLAINSSSHGAVETDAAEVGIAHPGNLGTADTANRPITRHEGRSTPPRVLSNIHTIIIGPTHPWKTHSTAVQRSPPRGRDTLVMSLTLADRLTQRGDDPLTPGGSPSPGLFRSVACPVCCAGRRRRRRRCSSRGRSRSPRRCSGVARG